MGFPGYCRSCGSLFKWTMAHGCVWVMCTHCPEQLEIAGTPPLVAKGEEFSAAHWEPSEGERVVLPEDGAVNLSEPKKQAIPYCPVRYPQLRLFKEV